MIPAFNALCDQLRTYSEVDRAYLLNYFADHLAKQAEAIKKAWKDAPPDGYSPASQTVAGSSFPVMACFSQTTTLKYPASAAYVVKQAGLSDAFVEVTHKKLEEACKRGLVPPDVFAKLADLAIAKHGLTISFRPSKKV